MLGQIGVGVGSSLLGARATSLTLSQRGEREPATPDTSEQTRHVDQLNSALPEARRGSYLVTRDHHPEAQDSARKPRSNLLFPFTEHVVVGAFRGGYCRWFPHFGSWF